VCSASRVAGEVRKLLPDDPERGSLELLPERCQLGRQRNPGEIERAPSRPDEALAFGVAENAAAEGHPLEDAADELAVLTALRTGKLRAELVELP
jgi:hypothetical protein